MKVPKDAPCPGSGSEISSNTASKTDPAQGKAPPPPEPAENLPPWFKPLQNQLCRLYALLLRLRGKKAYGPPYKYLGKGIELTRSKRNRAVSIFVLGIILHDLWIYMAHRG